MADRIVKEVEHTEREVPRETVVVRDKNTADRGSNTGLIIGIIIVVLLLLLLFGRGLFSGGSGSSGSSGSGSSSTSTGSGQ